MIKGDVYITSICPVRRHTLINSGPNLRKDKDSIKGLYVLVDTPIKNHLMSSFVEDHNNVTPCKHMRYRFMTVRFTEPW